MRLLLFIVAIGFFSCKSTKETTEQVANKPIEFGHVSAGTNSGFTTKTNVVITTQEKLNEVWKTANERFLDPIPVPEFDFKTKTIILVTRGQQNSGGFDIKVDKIIDAGKQVVVSILETTPGANCGTADVITFPYQLVEIPNTSKRIVFETTEKVYDCD